MTDKELHNLRFPVGEYSPKKNITESDIKQYIAAIEAFPLKIRNAVNALTDEQLNTPYRTGGWTIRQVVHHVGDSHMNSFMRFKLALTEDTPTIKTYFEDRWAELEDYKSTPLNISLDLLDNLHKRWVILLKSLTPEQRKRRFFHPEHNREIPLDELMCLYAWHCEHHLAHITRLKERMGW
ncbi:MAG TPA: bacillithiol transferase BstA [Ignavibacteria bacterium]